MSLKVVAHCSERQLQVTENQLNLLNSWPNVYDSRKFGSYFILKAGYVRPLKQMKTIVKLTSVLLGLKSQVYYNIKSQVYYNIKYELRTSLL